MHFTSTRIILIYKGLLKVFTEALVHIFTWFIYHFIPTNMVENVVFSDLWSDENDPECSVLRILIMA